MQFWTGWALWQKLSFGLAVAVAIVVIFSLSVVMYRKRSIKKHKAAEAYGKGDRDTERDSMLSESSDVPFGARALEQEIRGNGMPGHNIPQHPSTPTRTVSTGPGVQQFLPRPANVVRIPLQSYVPVVQSDQCESKRTSIDHGTRVGIAESVHPDAVQRPKPNESYIHESQELTGASNTRPSKKRFSKRSSWIGKPFDKRVSGEGSHPRTSSEEFRRRMSKLFDENAQEHHLEMFQLEPVPSKSIGSHREGSLTDSPRQVSILAYP
ncbi:hypothetical protein BDV25DRAFT_137485 [Aspergillus avenaceus]|uniref:Uncharacterized protein n=1 Tax=Aspergillus avenaceus TaxID=36643 RepID=A0A5N6U311_ASPAV|nr:hypothetical protein BDV25DRAFT_137485 [Aspergillus avenaceus]